GSTTHRLLLPNGTWKRLDEIVHGDRITLSRGTGLWPSDFVQTDWKPEPYLTHALIAEAVGVSPFTVGRHLKGHRTTSDAQLALLVVQYRSQGKPRAVLTKKRASVRVPELVNERFGAFLGYLIGDGHISDVKRTIGLTTGDEPQADHFARLTEELFGI